MKAAPSMNLERFTQDVIRCAGKVQREAGAGDHVDRGTKIITPADPISIAEAMRAADVQAATLGPFWSTPVRSVGVHPNGKRVIIFAAFPWFMVTVFFAITIVSVLFAWGLGYDAGRQAGWGDVITDTQLPTLPEGE